MAVAQRLALLTPGGVDAARADALADSLTAACQGADIAAVVLRLAPADERALTGLVKRLAPAVQDHGAALVVACPGFRGDLVSAAVRGGADGVHLDGPDPRALSDWRGRLRDGRILGAGGVPSRHAAMEAGEAGVDYLMFGGPGPDGRAPDPEAVRAGAEWWAEIFETPCIAVAAAEDEIDGLRRSGAEFLGLDGDLWTAEPGLVARIGARLRERAA